MATIPTVARSQVPAAPALGVRMDAGSVTQSSRALVQAGGAMQGVADMLGRFAMQKQGQINQGILAQEESIRAQTEAEVDSFITNNPDKPEEWQRFREQAWKGYEQGKTGRAKSGQWGPSVQAADKLATEGYRTQTDIRFKANLDKGLIRQSNARLLANADSKLRGGDYEGFVGEVDKMTLYPDQREETIRRGLEEGLYKTANNELDTIRQLPPAEAIPAYEEFLAKVGEKTEGGAYANYEFERGGMSLGGRMNLESIANARIRESQRAMDVNGRQLVGALRVGRATIADVDAMMRAGQIDEQTAVAMAPEMELAIREREDREAAKRQTEAQQEETRAQRLRADAVTPGRPGSVAAQDIERQIALGEISPERGSQIRIELEQASRVELTSTEGPVAEIRKMIRGTMGQRVGGRQPSEAEYREIQNMIIGAKVTKETRLALVGELFDLKLADIEDLEEDDGSWNLKDRQISIPERAMRRDMIAEYRRLLPALGDVLAGDLMLNQEAQIRDFFNAGDRTQEEARVFLREVLLPNAQQAAGFEALRDVYF